MRTPAAEEKAFQDAAKARLDRYTKALEAVAGPSGKPSPDLEKRLKSGEAESLTKALSRLNDLRTKAGQDIEKGKRARTDLQAELDKAFDGLTHGDLRKTRLELEELLPARSRGFEAKVIEALFDEGQRADAVGWRLEGDELGLAFLVPRLRGIGPRRDPLPGRGGQDKPPAPGPKPFTDCAGKPFALKRANFSGQGLGIHWGSAFTDPAVGNASGFGGGSVIIAGGAATYAEAVVGREVSWPAGFSTLRVEASLDAQASFHAIAAGLSGCGAGGDLLLEVSVNNGTAVRRTLPLGSVIAPVFWFADAETSGNFTLSLTVPIPPSAGKARLMAGIIAHSACGGIIGSGSSTSVGATVTSLCASLS